MADIIDKGYAHKVPADLQESSSVKWYIPHHGIYQLHKPREIHVVFDCLVKYQGKLLNDLLPEHVANADRSI